MAFVPAGPAQAQQTNGTFKPDELVGSGHKFFGNLSRGLALAIEEAVRRWGEPNGYILGQEGSGAFVAGLRYGEGTLYTRNAGDRRVFWQGPSLGFDFGGDGARTMMLVYNMQRTDSIFQRFGGVDGSLYFIAGFGFTEAVRRAGLNPGCPARVGMRDCGDHLANWCVPWHVCEASDRGDPSDRASEHGMMSVTGRSCTACADDMLP
jgi:hypothetical protein